VVLSAIAGFNIQLSRGIAVCIPRNSPGFVFDPVKLETFFKVLRVQ